MIESKFLSQFIMQEHVGIILTPMFCKHVINKFEQDEHTQPGSIGAGRNDDDIKRSTDLYISEFKDWEHEHNRFQQAYDQVMMSYAANIREDVHDIVNPFARTKKKHIQVFKYSVLNQESFIHGTLMSIITVGWIPFQERLNYINVLSHIFSISMM